MAVCSSHALCLGSRQGEQARKGTRRVLGCLPGTHFPEQVFRGREMSHWSPCQGSRGAAAGPARVSVPLRLLAVPLPQEAPQPGSCKPRSVGRPGSSQRGCPGCSSHTRPASLRPAATPPPPSPRLCRSSWERELLGIRGALAKQYPCSWGLDVHTLQMALSGSLWPVPPTAGPWERRQRWRQQGLQSVEGADTPLLSFRERGTGLS